MDAWRFILASLRHYRRIQIAVALGVAVATAVLTGALLVGDSLRGSLHDLTLQRLGKIDSILVTGQMFRAALAEELAGSSEFKQHFTSAQPAILLTGTLESGDGKRRATQAGVIGVEPGFWSLEDRTPPPALKDREVLITESIANEIGAKVGDEVLLRIPKASATPGDSLLGSKDSERSSSSIRLTVAGVLPAEGLARFGIVPSQQLPRNVFVPLATLQTALNQPGKANVILVSTDQPNRAAGEAGEAALAAALKPKLEDYGLKLESTGEVASGAQLSADALVLPDTVVRALQAKAGTSSVQPVVTYMANLLSAGEGESQRKTPYSTITGVDSTAELGPLLDEQGQPIALGSDEIALNRWAADDLEVKVGDAIRVKYYEPESTHGKLVERTTPPLRLRAIVELETADGKPTLAADPKLTPELAGVTDQKSISDWELPFELVEKVRGKDEDYWNDYRTTPKAFVSLETAKELWPSRWGTISLLRFSLPTNANLGELAAVIESTITPKDMGLQFLPVKAQGLMASGGTTPFEALFVGFSFFLIAAAVMLVALLFQLGIEERARELGTLAAIGLGRKRLTRLLVREGLLVAAAGATLGILGGVLYAGLMVYGLRTWWLAAISTPFIELHVSPVSLIIGWVIGVVVSSVTIWWSVRRLVRLPAARLLAGSSYAAMGSSGRAGSGAKGSRLPKWPTVRSILAVLAICEAIGGFFLQGESQAGIFFGSGATMLALLLGEVRFRLRNLAAKLASGQSFSLLKLASLNLARNPGRSTLTIGLVAAASFLIAAVSAFHLKTGDSGTGGFKYLATSDLPVHFDLNSPDGRRELGVNDQTPRGQARSDEVVLNDWRIFSLRVAAGENASCLNLYQPTQPRVLGVPQPLIDRGGFNFVREAKEASGAKPASAWRLLNEKLPATEGTKPAIPVILDAATAAYSLHLRGIGSQYTIHDGAGQPVVLEVVGLLENSILQGNLLVSEANFLRMFPEVAGYKLFLIEPKANAASTTAADSESGSADNINAQEKQSVPMILETTLSTDGFDVSDAREQLAQFLAVQNTYLSTFQSLGALGLLLGTIGLAVVQLRSVLERRGELALMRAAGFNSRRLTWMVIWENSLLLIGGLVVGCAAAAIALIPQWAPNAASIPWTALAVLLGTIALVGLLAGWLATRSTLRAPLVPALRGD